ncbi:hypothetical protein [Halorientalis regularis]|jgi:hypothetical protein|uniref:Uncharacterized protein n=1 Tax=Halorientalis regularis TaxID=660518 RepID=A0A1G7NNZ5_9EURY|nr:hypothetical protein [Halorientalis regularis]SDF75671.1 hypothetical protein SAMN05216218_10977 [Halorientalis regularis]
MSSEPAGTDDGAGPRVQEFAVTQNNTFEFMSGPLTGISCPCCFKDMLLKDVIRLGECNSCGAGLELSLTAETDDSG